VVPDTCETSGKDYGSRQAMGKTSVRPYPKIKLKTKGLGVWLKKKRKGKATVKPIIVYN
jgi:hypothetical protein